MKTQEEDLWPKCERLRTESLIITRNISRGSETMQKPSKKPGKNQMKRHIYLEEFEDFEPVEPKKKRRDSCKGQSKQPLK